ncbi:MAG: glutathione S-transferase family protein [Hyphomicrobiales bacterium]
MTERATLVSHHLCPYVQRAAIALAEKRVSFERRYIDLANKPEWFTAVSPLGKVPLLQVDGHVIFESAVILEYLEETRDRPLHPSDPLMRAEHRSWIEFGSTILNDIAGLYNAPDADTFGARQRALKQKFARLESVLDDGPWFAGQAFSLVDAVYGPALRYFDVFDRIADFGTFEHTPKVRRWRQRLSARPSISNAVSEDYADRLTAFLVRRNAHLSSLIAVSHSGTPA